MYKDRIQHVPVHHNVPYPVYVQPPPVNYHPPQPQKRVYHHPPKPVYNPLRKMNQPLFLKVALLARTKLPPIPNHTLKSIKIFTLPANTSSTWQRYEEAMALTISGDLRSVGKTDSASPCLPQLPAGLRSCILPVHFRSTMF
ncbi:uncharacterized protein LOC144108328 [Amblyomma americanum]